MEHRRDFHRLRLPARGSGRAPRRWHAQAGSGIRWWLPHCWRAIFLASLSNLAFSTGVAAVPGSADLRLTILLTGGGGLVSGALILWLWP